MCSWWSLWLWCQKHDNCVVCLSRGPQSLPKWVLHTGRSSVFSFSFQDFLASLSSSSSCLCLLLLHFLFPPFFLSVAFFLRQFLCTMFHIHSPSLLLLKVGSSFNPWLFILYYTIFKSVFYPLPRHLLTPLIRAWMYCLKIFQSMTNKIQQYTVFLFL